MLTPKYNSGTINITTNSAVSSPQIWAVAQRVEDDLNIVLTSTATGYDLDIKLTGRALAAAAKANPGVNLRAAPIRLASYDEATNTLETHPATLTVGTNYFLHPKYNKIRTIKFEGYGNLHDGFGNLSLDQLSLPSGFVRDMFAGFGAHYELRLIIRELERAGITDLVLSEYMYSSIQGATAHITYDLFDRWRRAVKRGHNRAVLFGNSAKLTYLRNELASELGLIGIATTSAGDPVQLADSVMQALELPGRLPPVAAASAVVKAARKSSVLAKAQESELLALNREIELLTLEGLIARLDDHMGKTHNEAFWQRFLSDNPFIIRLAFGLPVAIFGEQVAMGGTKFDGSGGKIADYLLRIGSYGNMAIIEIKTPGTDLLNLRHYRGGVYAPSKDVAGAVTQVLDQRYQLHMEINNKKAASGQHDVFTYAMQGLVIAGRDLDDRDHRKSFELFRNGLKDVTIITFSELLQKLKALHAFLTAGQQGETKTV